MDYELAKELKEAGFPFNDHVPYLATDINGNPVELDDYVVDRYPTLSELIEATNCRYLMVVEEGTWVAGAFPHDGPTYGTHHASPKCSTPEEAVARLWLALKATP